MIEQPADGKKIERRIGDGRSSRVFEFFDAQSMRMDLVTPIVLPNSF